MENPFKESSQSDLTDSDLVQQALEGDMDALESLVMRHQGWLYNIAVRMVWNRSDAEDVTQEVLVKAVTKLSTFRKESSFRTWLYRIACNHCLNMTRRPAEKQLQSFSQFAEDLEQAPDLDLPDPASVPVDLPVLVEEAKLGCMTAMLLGLNRQQRLVYVLVELLGATTQLAAELMEVSQSNLRQILSRARRELYDFMNGNCGLVNRANRCRCADRTAGFIQAGYVDPKEIRFATPSSSLRELHAEALETLKSKVDEMHREQQLSNRWHDRADQRSVFLRFMQDPAVRSSLCLED